MQEYNVKDVESYIDFIKQANAYFNYKRWIYTNQIAKNSSKDYNG